MTDGFIACLIAVRDRCPAAPALVENDVVLSYDALTTRVARLGSAMIECGLGPEDVVGLALEKSTEYVVAMLACWYAGAAFVPLDSALPVARRAAYLRRAKARWVLVACDADEDLGARYLRTDSEPNALHGPATPDSQHLAYVIFTSGSTGEPKGVMVATGGLLPMLEAQIALFELGPGARSLWLLATAFDASISDIGTALLAGATLYIEPKARTATPEALQATLTRLEITYLDLPPALLPHLTLPKPPALRTVVIGGEVCDEAAIRRWAAELRLMVVYGPTEATVCTSAVQATVDWERPLLGSPLPGIVYAVVGEDGRRCLPGQAGELMISGPGLARGYLDAPTLSSTRFGPSPLGRAYRSGDRVVQSTKGELIFLGRIDRQLKVRGALVAPEEIEACLIRHGSVRRAALLAHGPRAALTAFLEGDASQEGDLQAWLAARLPAFMLPERLVWLESLPLTASGKPDLPALQALRLTRTPLGPAPASELERRLASVFQDVLGCQVGRDDDFFALGGSSLQMIALLALAAQRGLALTPALIAAHPGLGRLAAALAEAAEPSMPASGLRARVRTELRLLDDLPKRASGSDAEHAVLVTGATGFLGSRVVYEVLRASDCRVLCLVRADNDQAGRARLLATFKRYGLEVGNTESARIVPVLGDLSQVMLGMCERNFVRLADRVDTVFHCGAQVSLMADCETLWPSNVVGTREVLRLVATGRTKALHYASTLSVFVSADGGEGRFQESDTLSQTQQVYGGYAATKWAAEVLVREAARQLPTVTIHRLGLLTGDSQSGHGAPHDWLALTVQGLAQLGAVPEQIRSDLAMDVTPIDYAARAMVAIAARDEPGLATTHLAGHSVGLAEIAGAMAAAGAPLAPLANAAWLERLHVLHTASPSPHLGAAYLALSRLCAESRPERALDLFQATRCHFDDRQARSLLARSGISCPVVDSALLTRYVRHILAHGG